jgi:predicted RNase H-like HicB family nuclease
VKFLEHTGIRNHIVTASYTYSVILEPAEEGGFVVHVPVLPEICTEGDTEDEALAMAKDAIELVIESRLERGEPVPSEFQKPIMRQVTVSRAA